MLIYVIISATISLLLFKGWGRMCFALLQTLQPLLLSIPWVFQLSNRRRPKVKKKLLKIGVQDEEHMPNLNENLRNEIVEYLLKGIKKSMNITKVIASDRIEDDEDSCFARFLRLLFCSCSCCEDKDDEESLRGSVLDPSSIRFKEMELKGHILLNKQAIIREANCEV